MYARVLKQNININYGQFYYIVYYTSIITHRVHMVDYIPDVIIKTLSNLTNRFCYEAQTTH